MPKYKCVNNECPSYDVIKHESAKLRSVDGKIKDITLPCPSCGLDRIEIKEEFSGFTTYMHGGPNIPKN